jgi:hypothetical protein
MLYYIISFFKKDFNQCVFHLHKEIKYINLLFENMKNMI